MNKMHKISLLVLVAASVGSQQLSAMNKERLLLASGAAAVVGGAALVGEGVHWWRTSQRTNGVDVRVDAIEGRLGEVTARLTAVQQQMEQYAELPDRVTALERRADNFVTQEKLTAALSVRDGAASGAMTEERVRAIVGDRERVIQASMVAAVAAEAQKLKAMIAKHHPDAGGATRGGE